MAVAALVGVSAIITLAVLRAPSETPRQRPEVPAAPMADNGRIAFVSDRSGTHKVYTVNVDGTGLRVMTKGRAALPLWSPDGTRVAVVHDPGFWGASSGYADFAKPRIHVLGADGTVQARFPRPRGAREIGQLAWSPDGHQIAFVASRLSIGGGDLYLADVEEARLQRLTSTPQSSEEGPVWAPDGSKILFVSSTERPANADILVVNGDGSGLRALTMTADRSEESPVWSPDGSRILFVSTTKRPRNRDVLMMQADGMGVREVMADPSRNESEPQWSPDGRSVAFSGDGDIFVVGIDGTGLTGLSEGRRKEEDPRWSPTGASVAFVSARDRWSSPDQLHLSRPDGTGQRTITTHLLPPFVWSPDGSSISFVLGPENREIVVWSEEGMRTVTRNALSDVQPAWQPIPSGLTPPQPPASRRPRSLPPEGVLLDHCGVSGARGDFDEDKKRDLALVYTPRSARGSCPSEDDLRPPRRIAVFFGNGRRFDEKLACSLREFRDFPISEGCSAFAAPDFDADGRAELALGVGGGSASMFVFAVYRVQPRELVRVEVPPPGRPDLGFPPGPIEFWVGGSPGVWSALVCRTAPDGGHVVTAIDGSYSQSSYRLFDISEVSLTFDGEEFQVVSDESFVLPWKRVERLASSLPRCGDEPWL